MSLVHAGIPFAMSSGSSDAYLMRDAIADERLKEKAPSFDRETIGENEARVRGWVVFCGVCQHTHARIQRKKGRCFTCDCGDRHQGSVRLRLAGQTAAFALGGGQFS